MAPLRSARHSTWANPLAATCRSKRLVFRVLARRSVWDPALVRRSAKIFNSRRSAKSDDDEEKDSSQVIALDELSEESAGAPLPSGFGEAAMIGDDFGAVALRPVRSRSALRPAAELPFSIWNVLGLVELHDYARLVRHDDIRPLAQHVGMGRCLEY